MAIIIAIALIYVKRHRDGVYYHNSDMGTLANRLKESREEKGFSQSELAKRARLKNQSIIGSLESGHRKSSSYIPAIAKELGVHALWLSEGKLPKYIEPKAEHLSMPDKIGGRFYEIPQYEAGGAMGDGLILRDQPGLIQSWRVNKEWLSKNVKGYSSSRNLCIVTGFGDSMRPLFNSGDPVLIDTSVKTVEFDSVYFFRVGEEGFIKRLQRIPGEGLRVLSANRDQYEPWTIKPDMDFEILGRVLKVWRSEDF